MKTRSGQKIKMTSVEELLGVANEEVATEIELNQIQSFRNHPFKVLAGIDCIGFKDDSNQKLLQDINSFLEQYVE